MENSLNLLTILNINLLLNDSKFPTQSVFKTKPRKSTNLKCKLKRRNTNNLQIKSYSKDMNHYKCKFQKK